MEEKWWLYRLNNQPICSEYRNRAQSPVGGDCTQWLKLYLETSKLDCTDGMTPLWLCGGLFMQAGGLEPACDTLVHFQWLLLVLTQNEMNMNMERFVYFHCQGCWLTSVFYLLFICFSLISTKIHFFYYFKNNETIYLIYCGLKLGRIFYTNTGRELCSI